ncbi:MAG: hypothetical protein SGPRY_008645, partial [Prymnesium sp.]
LGRACDHGQQESRIRAQARSLPSPFKIELYNACRDAAAVKGAQWYYETTGPGSGLPVISTLKDMIQSGDDLDRVEGIFSGTASYLVNSASELGLCEPDPRDDLTGLDVKRKLVVLARELGLPMEIDDVESDTLMPPELESWEPDTTASLLDQLCSALEPYESRISERVEAAKAEGKLLVPVGCVDVKVSTTSTPRTTARAHGPSITLGGRRRIQLRLRVRVGLEVGFGSGFE